MWNFGRYYDNIAVIDDMNNQFTYKDLNAEANCLAETIGDRCLVFILCDNCIGSLIGYVSFINNRIVPVMLSSNLEKSMLENLIELYLPKYIWSPNRLAEDFSQFDVIYSAFDYSLFKTGFDIEFRLFDDLALLLTTSGSTGSPKFVRQSYSNIRSNTDSIVEYLRLDESERPITTLPMNYTYGLSIINSHLDVGATILLTNKGVVQREFWSFFKEFGATSFGGVPYTYEMLDKLRFTRMSLPSLKTMTQAGGKLTPELHEKYALFAAANNLNFVVMYGQCEATARMGYLPPSKAVEKKGSMGIAIPGGQFRLIDNNGDEITSANTTGELVYEGPNVTLGYANCGDDLIKGDERNGVLVTGDMAQFDSDGYYYIVGRKKRFLKVYGNRVNLDEVDRMIESKYDIEVACAGIDDHMYIFVTNDLNSEEIIEYVSHCTKLHSSAFIVKTISSIPYNDSGKVLYSELEKYY